MVPVEDSVIITIVPIGVSLEHGTHSEDIVSVSLVVFVCLGMGLVSDLPSLLRGQGGGY